MNNSQMSRFVEYKNNYYIYNQNGKEFEMDSELLSSYFKTYGYCVDPSNKFGQPLSEQAILDLINLAKSEKDYSLLKNIKKYSNGKAPSPRMINDGIMYETTLNEKHRFKNLDPDNKADILAILRTILNIGLYLGGWKGNEEPYITSLRDIHDMIRVELKIIPSIESLYKNDNYPLVKNFPIMNYYKSSLTLNPSVVNNSLDLDQCLNSISSGILEPNFVKQMATHLISTSYYYITTICNTPLTLIDPLIQSFAKTTP